MSCEFYKGCHSYDPNKDSCVDGSECRIWDSFNLDREYSAKMGPSHNPEIITPAAGLEILAIDEEIKQNRINVSTHK